MAEHGLPPRPRTSGGATPQSLPSTPASGNRRKRQAVGFTNRSQAAALDGRPQSSAHARRPSTSTGNDDRPHSSNGLQRPPLPGSSRGRPMEAQSDLLMPNTGGRTTATFLRGTMTRPETADKPLARQIRDKILKNRLNLGPVLRQKSDNGYITPHDMKHVLSAVPQLAFSEEELDFLAGADGGAPVHVHDFMLELKVPDYDDYDPWGKSKAREQLFLRKKASNLPPRHFNRPVSEEPPKPLVPSMGKKADEGEASPGGGAPSKPKRKPGAGIARKYMRQINDEMEMKGVTLLDIFRKIDIDASGSIDQNEFEQAVEIIGVPGMQRQQMAFLFKNVDENNNGKVDIHELHMALMDSKNDDGAGSSAGATSRPSTFRPDDTGGGSALPWAQSTRGTRLEAVLPPDHFNLRFRRSLMPPYATSETVRNVIGDGGVQQVVPIKTAFAFNPEHLRYSTVTLANGWLTDGTGQGDVQKLRYEARIERKRQAEARMRCSVDLREKVIEDMDRTRICGLSRTRADWMARLAGPWA